MKKIGLLLIIALLIPVFAPGQEIRQGGSVFSLWQKSLEEYKIPGVPVVFAKRIDSHLIGFGFLLNSPESFELDSPLRVLMQEFPLFQAALLLQGEGLNSSIVFNYEKNHIWGLSAKFSF